ncbi:hypothetical protein H4S08_002871 [Coemansia sp. RSA 1365]|nr:hypothetical protein H4S08_002871 [Coemansia sp. RSA 1365]
MATDLSFFDATLAQLSQMSVQRSLATETRIPDGLRYPPQNFDFKMPPIRTSFVASEEREDFFTLTFKTLKAPVRRFTLHTSSVRTVAQVKRHLSRVSGIASNNMRLVLGGKGLVDSKLIGDYAIQDDSVIQIISKPAGATPSPLPEADEVSVVDAAQANPLSSVLGQRSGTAKDVDAAVAQAAAMERNHAATGYTTDASSDGESGMTLNQATKDQLQQKNSAFRNNLRELIHNQFSSSQAGVVDRILDGHFASL